MLSRTAPSSGEQSLLKVITSLKPRPHPSNPQPGYLRAERRGFAPVGKTVDLCNWDTCTRVQDGPEQQRRSRGRSWSRTLSRQTARLQGSRDSFFATRSALAPPPPEPRLLVTALPRSVVFHRAGALLRLRQAPSVEPFPTVERMLRLSLAPAPPHSTSLHQVALTPPSPVGAP